MANGEHHDEFGNDGVDSAVSGWCSESEMEFSKLVREVGALVGQRKASGIVAERFDLRAESFIPAGGLLYRAILCPPLSNGFQFSCGLLREEDRVCRHEPRAGRPS